MERGTRRAGAGATRWEDARAGVSLGPVMRIYQEIARHRESNPDDLLADVLWRIQKLRDVLHGPIDLTDQPNREAFSDVLQAFVPNGFGLVLVPSHGYDCEANLDAGGKISFCGLLTSGDAAVAELARTLWLGHGVAQHHRLTVVPRYRGNRIAPRSLVKCVEIYDALRLKEVHLRAALSGSWYWAQWGFRFRDLDDLIRLQRHTQEIVDAFGADLDVSGFTHPQQFFFLGDETPISFSDLIDAFPRRKDAYEELAYENGISLHREIPFGRAVLLTGPSWDGSLNLAKDGADRLIFDDVARKMLKD
jgi:hypothetical protein